MKKNWKRIVTLLMALVLFVGMVPAPIQAASTTYLEVTRDNAPIRAKSHDEGKIIDRCEKGVVLKSSGAFLNYKLNKWYKVEYQGKTRYIYSGNVKTHKHAYQNLNYDGVTYQICDCGKVNVKATTQIKSVQANAIAGYASQYGSLAATSSALDGPIPAGDIIGLLILAYGAYVVSTGAISRSAAHSISIDLDFDEYLKENRNVCSEASFRLVQRHKGSNLTYIGKQCYNAAQAYILARFGADVYTKYQPNAFLAASMHPKGCYSEIDKNQPNYYYHYHLGADKNSKTGGHIFFGSSPNGLTPA